MACGLLLHYAWWTDTSLSGRSEGVHWLASSLRRRDSELSACYAAARSCSMRIMMGPSIFECRGLREPSEQGCCDRYVLTRPGEMQEAPIVLNDPLVHLAGPGVRATTVSSSRDLLLELRTFLLELEPRTQLLLLHA